MKTTYLGLDFGDKRVGIAISDWTKGISFPRDFFEYDELEVLIDQLKRLCDEERVEKIVLGLPLHMNGEVGDRAKKTYVFADSLKKKMPDMDIVLFDERLSTEYANQSLQKQGIRAKNQKGKRDALSAQIILQNYLNSL